MPKAHRRPTSKRRQPAALEGNKPWRDRARVRTASARDKSAWDRLAPHWQHAITLGVLLLVALWFTAPTTFGGRTLMGGDVVQWRGAAQAMIDYEEATGTDALWSPNVFAGMPGFLIYYPLKAVGIDTIPRMVREAGLWPLSHLLVMLGGAYALAYFLSRSKLGALLGALAYGLTTYVPLILVSGHNTKFVALAWAPWLLLAFAAALYRPDEAPRLRSALLALLFAIAIAVNLRAGHVQITYYAAFLAGVWWLVEGIAAVRLKNAGRFAVSTAILAVGAALGVAMAAQPYLATWVYKAYTIRGAGAGAGGGMAWERAMAWSQAPGELLTMVIAGAYGGGGQTYWGPKTFTAGPHYVGAVVALLAVFGAFGVRRRAATGLAVGAAVMAAFALGENLALLNRPAFALIPLFDAFRAPETWLVIVALALAVLAAYGSYWVARREVTPEADLRKTRWIYLGLGVGIVFLTSVWAVGPAMLPLEKEGEAAQIAHALASQSGVSPDDPRVAPAASEIVAEMRVERAGMLRSDAGRSLLFLLVGGALLVLYRRDAIPAWVAQGGLALLVLFDLGSVGRRYFNSSDPALRIRPDQESAVPRYAFDTYLEQRAEEAGGAGRFRVLPFVPSLGLTPTSDGRSAFFYESIGGYHGAKLAVFEDFTENILYTGPTGVDDRALDLMSVRYVVAQGALPGMPAVFQDPATGVMVLENTDAMPRAFFVDSVALVEDRETLIARMRSPSFDPRRIALLSPPVAEGVDLSFYTGPPSAPQAVQAADSLAPALAVADTTTSVALQRFSPREIVYVVRTDRPRFLVFSEIYYPDGWVASVDDGQAPIMRADFLLRAVPVPSGRHIVELRFDPPAHRIGVMMSTISALLVYLGALTLAGLLWYRRGHPPKL